MAFYRDLLGAAETLTRPAARSDAGPSKHVELPSGSAAS